MHLQNYDNCLYIWIYRMMTSMLIPAILNLTMPLLRCQEKNLFFINNKLLILRFLSTLSGAFAFSVEKYMKF